MKKHQYRYDLIFDGRIRNGFTYEGVAQHLKEKVKLDEVQITELFSGRVRVCKNADYNTVLQIHKKFFELGLELKLSLQAKPETKTVPVANNKAPEQFGLAPGIKAKKKIELPQKLTAQTIAKDFSSAPSSYIRRASAVVGFATAAMMLGVVTAIYGGAIIGLLLLLYQWSAAGLLYAGSGVAAVLIPGISLLGLSIGSLLLLMLMKPLVAHYSVLRKRQLDTKAHYKFYTLLGLLCDYLDVAHPVEVYVDEYPGVSVFLKQGIAGIAKKQYILVVGMPLFAALNARQMVGVLTGVLSAYQSRLILLACQFIQSINNALYRRAYQRDRWDIRLESISKRYRAPIQWLAKSFLICAVSVRYFMRLQYLLARLLSRPFLNKIKHDAVELQCRVIGYHAYKHLLLEINKIGLSWDKISGINTALRAKNKLLENIPAAISEYVKHHDAALSDQVRNGDNPRLERELPMGALNMISKSGKGIFSHQNPARELIAHFEELSCYVTEQHYLANGIYDNTVQLLAVEQVSALAPGRKISEHVLDTFFNGLYNGRRYLVLDKEYSREISLLTHQKLVDHLRWKSLDFKHALDMYEDKLKKLKRMELGKEYLKAGIKFNLTAYHLKKQTYSYAVREISLVEGKLEENSQTLVGMDSLFKRRFELCYRTMNNSDKQKLKNLLGILSLMQRHESQLIQLERYISTLSALIEERDKRIRNKMDVVIEHYRSICCKLMGLLLVKADNIIMLTPSGENSSLGIFLRTHLGHDVENLHHIDDRQCVSYGGLLLRLMRNKYSQLLASLAELCALQEKNQGIKPLKLLLS